MKMYRQWIIIFLGYMVKEALEVIDGPLVFVEDDISKVYSNSISYEINIY